MYLNLRGLPRPVPPSLFLAFFLGFSSCLLLQWILEGNRPEPLEKSVMIPGVSRDYMLPTDYSNYRLRALIEEMSCRAFGIGTRGGFCLTPTEPMVGYNYVWCPVISNILDDLFEGQTVGDFGCGLGQYGRFFLRRGDRLMPYSPASEETIFLNNSEVQAALKKPQKVLTWTGFDGAGNIEAVIKDRFIKFLDLSEEQHLPEKYNWVMSLEVGEHIPAVFEDTFLDNVVRHACNGVILSWAIPGQEGHYHVNCRDNNYIKAKMAKRGFINDLAMETWIRRATHFPHFKNTLMVFNRAVPLDDESCVKRIDI
ncbi:uncharacterized protein LOC111088934 isoform X1 [Limulus polyphemus]|uniref:Uncharacterized protein LOC111088934 isoform X1 n=1 Tax=Limulus polyphemus TaxID=6850 RepID=A0ABM1TJD6_LIMPO|nr:uncharacterized protein LOC111088934 isoform X1 [Limulus polyphemus]